MRQYLCLIVLLEQYASIMYYKHANRKRLIQLYGGDFREAGEEEDINLITWCDYFDARTTTSKNHYYDVKGKNYITSKFLPVEMELSSQRILLVSNTFPRNVVRELLTCEGRTNNRMPNNIISNYRSRSAYCSYTVFHQATALIPFVAHSLCTVEKSSPDEEEENKR